MQKRRLAQHLQCLKMTEHHKLLCSCPLTFHSFLRHFSVSGFHLFNPNLHHVSLNITDVLSDVFSPSLLLFQFVDFTLMQLSRLHVSVSFLRDEKRLFLPQFLVREGGWREEEEDFEMISSIMWIVANKRCWRCLTWTSKNRQQRGVAAEDDINHAEEEEEERPQSAPSNLQRTEIWIWRMKRDIILVLWPLVQLIGWFRWNPDGGQEVIVLC